MWGINKKPWNGEHPIITGVVTIKDGIRRWPIKVKSSKPSKSIKASNVRAIGKMTIYYKTDMVDLINTDNKRTFKSEHKNIQFMKEIGNHKMRRN